MKGESYLIRTDISTVYSWSQNKQRFSFYFLLVWLSKKVTRPSNKTNDGLFKISKKCFEEWYNCFPLLYANYEELQE